MQSFQNNLSLMNYLWMSIATWEETDCVYFVRTAYLQARGVGWFLSSWRLRQDCQFPSTAHLENACWHPCSCLHLSFIYRASCTFDRSADWYVTQMLSCSCSPGRGRLYADETVESVQCSTLHTTESASHSRQFIMIYRVITSSTRGESSLCCVLFHLLRERLLWSMTACQLGLWLTGEERTNKMISFW